jgi:signal transduction histidine kinase
MELFIGQSIIESHGGRLLAVGDSRMAQAFYFTLPARMEPWE